MKLTNGNHANRGARNTLTIQSWDDPTANSLTTDWYEASDTTSGQLSSESTATAELCHSNLADVVKYFGVAFVARDSMQIVEALGEDGMLQFGGK